MVHIRLIRSAQRSAAEQRGLSSAGNRISKRLAVRLSDVADVVDGTGRYPPSRVDHGTPAVLVNVQRQPGANIIQVVDRIKALSAQSD